MGEIADSMLEGECCQLCGEWLDDFLSDGHGSGFPQTCNGCMRNEKRTHALKKRKKKE